MVHGLLFVVCAVVVCLAKAQWVFSPSPPVANIPVQISTTVQVGSIFLSLSPSCGSTVSGGSVALLSSGRASFQVYLSNTSTVFVCDAQTFIQLTSVDFVLITFTPRYAIRTVVTSIVFPSFTPNGTVALMSYSDCSGPIAAQQALTSNSVSVSVSSSGFYFLCLTFLSTVTMRSVTTNVGQFVVADLSSFSPQNVVRYQFVSFEISGAAPPAAKVTISTVADCSTVAQGPFTAAGTFGKTVTTTIALARGTYTFCIEVPLASGVLIPSGNLNVQAYTASPSRLFPSVPTVFSFFLDSTAVTSPVALATGSACVAPFVVASNPVAGQVNWTVPSLGTYYSCAYHEAAQTFIRASVHVVEAPASVVTPVNFVRAFPATVSFTSPQVVIGPLAAPLLTFSLGASQTLIAPLSAPSMVEVWVPTSDSSYWYQYPSVVVVSETVSHLPLFVGEPATLVFDPPIPTGVQIRFSSTNACTDGVTWTFPHTGSFVFPLAGAKYVCANGSIFGFQPFAVDQVYPVPTASPTVALANRSTEIFVQDVPAGNNITVTTEADCSGTTIAAVLSSDSGTTTIVRAVSRVPELYVCASYNSVGLPPVTRNVQQVMFFGVSASPTIQLAGRTSQYVLQCAEPSLLLGQEFFVGTSCDVPVEPTSPVMQAAGRLSVTITPTVVGSALLGCVGSATLGFVSVGATRVAPSFAFTQQIALVGLPFNVTFDTPFYSPQFYALSRDASCNTTFVRGAFGATTVVTLVLASAAASTFACVVADDGVTLLPAGEFVISTFFTTTTTLLRLTAQPLTVSVQPSGTSLFLAATRECGSPQYVTVPLLTAPVGTYFVCQGVGGGYTSASTNRVLVVSDFAGTWPAEVRSFIPFVVNITGGDLSNRTSPVPAFLYASPSCSGAPLGSFLGSTSAILVTLPTMQFVESFLCLSSADLQVTSLVARFSPLPYMTPYTVVGGVPAIINSGGMVEGFGLVAPDQSCSFAWMAPQAIRFGAATYTVPSGTATVGVYCESSDGVLFAARGILNVLRLTAPSGQQTVIFNQTALPATPIAFSVNASVALDPFFSDTSSCTNVVDLSVAGYVPEENEVAYFFVCVLTPDRTLRYTTPYPTVRVLGYTVSPLALGAGAGNQTVSLSSPIPAASAVFGSYTRSCASSLFAASLPSASGVTAVVNPDATVDGIVFLCLPFQSRIVPIASLLVSQRPRVVNHTLAVLGVLLCLHVEAVSSTYSLTGSTVGFEPFVGYYRATNRSVFVAASPIACVQGVGVSPSATVGADGTVCVTSEGLSTVTSYTVCAGTPSGFLPVSTVSFDTVRVSPSFVVSGARTNLTASGAPSSSLAFGTTGCAVILTEFATDASSSASVVAVADISGAYLAPQGYAVCLRDPVDQWIAVSAITVTPTTHFGISNENAVQGVPTNVDLLQDFNVTFWFGISASTACTPLPSGVMNAVFLNATRVQLTASAAGAYYVCGRTPVNETVVVVASIRVVAPFAQYVALVATCATATVGITDTTFRDAAFSLQAANRSCCGAFPTRTLIAASGTGTLVRSYTVVDTQLEAFAPLRTFAMCATMGQACFDIGTVAFVSSACSLTPSPVTPAPGNNQGPNSSSSTRQDIVSSAQTVKSQNWSTTVVLGAVFAGLLLLLALVALVMCCLRSRRIVPVDAEAAGAEETSEWKRTFDSIAAARRGPLDGATLNSLMNVPIPMRLDVCCEAPIPMQRLELLERDERAALVDVERETFQQLASFIVLEWEEARLHCAALDRTRVLQRISNVLRAELGALQDDETAMRQVAMDDEERSRLAIIDAEKVQWRQRMDLEGQRLRSALARDPFWQNRRTLLRQATARAMASVNASPAHPQPPLDARTLLVDQEELEARYAKTQGKELW